MNVKVYVEGGGDRRETQAKCRKGFNCFFHKTELAGQMPKVKSCGSRQKTYDDFCAAWAKVADDVFIVLLVDSEGPVAGSPWPHLKNRDNWRKPPDATDNNAHLMVQCMEAWFLADVDTLAGYFGDGFNRNALPGQPNVECIPKADLDHRLKMATRYSTRKGAYHKGKHSFAILSMLNPKKVTDASHHAKRLISILLDKASGQD